MKITISNTEKIVTINGVPARIWEGETESKIPVICFITRIAVESNIKANHAQFEKELKEQAPPSVEAQEFPLKMII